MGWKDWPYWLKAGIFGLVFFVIFFLFMSMITYQGRYDKAFYDAFLSMDELWIFNYILVLVFFIVGAVIGWIYGKIKNRNK